MAIQVMGDQRFERYRALCSSQIEEDEIQTLQLSSMEVTELENENINGYLQLLNGTPHATK